MGGNIKIKHKFAASVFCPDLSLPLMAFSQGRPMGKVLIVGVFKPERS